MAFELKRIERTREYEIIYIIKPDLSEDQITELTKKVDGIIAENGGEILRTTLMGKRKLFYEIKGNLRGIFVHSVFLGKNKLVPELERRLRISEDVVRYQTIKLEDHVRDVEGKKAYYKSQKFEDMLSIISKPTKEVKDDYDKFKPKGV